MKSKTPKCSLPNQGRQLEIFLDGIKDLPDHCLEWWGSQTHSGYGRFAIHIVGTRKSKTVQAHRHSFSYYFNREIPQGLYVCHKCDNPLCFNPKHLFVGSAKENMQDCLRKGRWSKYITPRRREANARAKLTTQDIQDIQGKHKPRVYTRQMLAEEYNVSMSLIAKVISGVVN